VQIAQKGSEVAGGELDSSPAQTGVAPLHEGVDIPNTQLREIIVIAAYAERIEESQCFSDSLRPRRRG
jgi:hypothetical protein